MTDNPKLSKEEIRQFVEDLGVTRTREEAEAIAQAAAAEKKN